MAKAKRKAEAKPGDNPLSTRNIPISFSRAERELMEKWQQSKRDVAQQPRPPPQSGGIFLFCYRKNQRFSYNINHCTQISYRNLAREQRRDV